MTLDALPAGWSVVVEVGPAGVVGALIADDGTLRARTDVLPRFTDAADELKRLAGLLADPAAVRFRQYT